MVGLFAANGCGSDDPSKQEDVKTDVAEGDVEDADADTVLAEVTPPEPFRTDLSIRPPEGAVVAGIAAKPADLIGGPKAEAVVGDLKIANNKATYMIEGARHAGGYRQNGGHVVDLDLQPGGEDRFGEMWFAWNFRVFTPDTVTIVSDGSDGRAVARISGRLGVYAWIDALLGDIFGTGDTDMAVTLEYSMAPDSVALDVKVILTNDTAADIFMEWPLIASNMGDGASLFSVGSGFDAVDPGPLPAMMVVGLKRSYALVSRNEVPPEALLQITSVQIAKLAERSIVAGESVEYQFTYLISDDGTNGLDALRAANYGGEATARITGTVQNETPWAENELVPSHTFGLSRVVAKRGDAVVAIVPVKVDGTYEIHVLPGDVTVQAFAPQRGFSDIKSLVAVANEAVEATLALSDLGRVDVRVRDPEGAVIPAQVQFFRVGETPSPFGPTESRYEADWGNNRSAVAFHTEEQATVHLLPGEYRVFASRGYSWEVDETTITVAPGLTEALNFTLSKTVDDDGWVAADQHLHAFWSPDADVPYPTRLLQAAANDITLPIFTEHTYMGDIAPARQEARVDAWVTPINGQEVTTAEYGHFNAYPLELKLDAPSFGAVFEHGRVGSELFDAIRAQTEGDKIIQINHPRTDGGLMAYFAFVKLPTNWEGTTSVQPEAPERWAEDWDVIEVFNGDCNTGGGNGQTLKDWLGLYDLGVRKGLASGSDSHTEAAGLGHPRAWIPVTKGQVDIDPEVMVAPVRNRETFVSCGPFVRFATDTGTGMGGLAGLDESGEVRFAVSVEAPSWMTIDTVRLLERGVVVQEADVAAWNTNDRPEGIRAGIRYEGVFTAKPTTDSWFLIEVVGSGGLSSVKPGQNPYAMTNPIDVDADGDDEWSAPAVAGVALPAATDTKRIAPGTSVDKHAHDHHESDHEHFTPEFFQRRLLELKQRQHQRQQQ